MKRINHFFGQQTQDWHDMKAGKFTSSEIYPLFSEVPKIERCREVVKRINSSGVIFPVKINEEIKKIADNDYMNYVGKELKLKKILTKLQFDKAKKDLKLYLEGEKPLNVGSSLILDCIAGIEQIEMLGGAAYTYIYDKAIEIVYESQEINAGGAACDWGNEWEPVAAMRFRQSNFYAADTPKLSFCELEGMETGTSPDDTENYKNPSEYKCPKSRKIHIAHTKIRNDIELLAYSPQKYYQIHHQNWCLGSDSGFWSSYDPRLEQTKESKHLALHTIQVETSDNLKTQFESKILMAIKQRDEIVKELRG